MSHWLQVVVAAPAHSVIAGPLTYKSATALEPGTLVRVPFGRREVLGVVWKALPDSGGVPEETLRRHYKFSSTQRPADLRIGRI